MRSFHSITSVVILSFLASCSSELDLPQFNPSNNGSQVADGTLIDVPFSVHYSPLTRSNLSVGEDYVENINVVAFKGGQRVTFVYTTPDSDISLQFIKGESYNIYALANVGAVSIPSREEDFLAYSYSIDDIDDLNGGFPMWWKLEGFTAGVLTTPVDIELERLVAKVRLSIFAPDMQGFEVTSVRLCQAASTIRPFADGGSRALSGETIDGDYASAADLMTINNGGSICFYTFENCQGTLLEGNNDAWNKVPGNIGGKGDVCTYIEITCEHDGSFLLDGTVTYRMYLGADNCSNFDILRNKNYNLTLTATYAGMSQADISWKVDMDAELGNVGLIQLDKSMHQEDDLYIGEIVLVGLDTSSEFEAFNGGAPTDCDLVLVRNGLLSDAVKFTPITGGSVSKYECEMTCLKEFDGTGDIYLSKDGSLIAKVPFRSDKKVRIQKPRMMFGEVRGDGKVSSVTNQPLKINGDTQLRKLFLTDNEGRNLNDTKQYGFYLGLFSDIEFTPAFSIVSSSAIPSVLSKLSITKVNGTELSNNYAFAYVAALNNDGINAEVCVAFSDLLSIDGDIFSVNAHEQNAIDSNDNIKIGILSTKYTIDQGDSFMDIDGSEGGTVYFSVSNPSKIAFTLYTNIYGLSKELPGLGQKYTLISDSSSSNNYALHRGYVKNDIMWISPTQHRRAIFGTSSFMTILPSECTTGMHSNFSPTQRTTDYYGNPIDFLAISNDVLPRDYYNAWGVSSSSPLLNSDFEISPCVQDIELDDVAIVYNPGGTIGHVDWSNGAAIWKNYANGENVEHDLYRSENKIQTSHPEYTPRKLFELLTGSPLKIKAELNNNGLCYIVENNDQAIDITIEAILKYSGTCTWQSYSTQSSTTDTHQYAQTITTNLPSSSSSTTIARPKTQIVSDIKSLNRNYWHNCCDKAVASKSNRHSKFTIPKTLSITWTISFNGIKEWQSIEIDDVIAISFSESIYTQTADGYYADQGTTNPDGTTRDCKNIDSYGLTSVKSTTFSGFGSGNITINNDFVTPPDHFYELQHK